MSTAFVGRRAELESLAAEWERAQGGCPSVVLVDGPAGIGKTALLRRFLESRPEAHCLHADGDEDETALSFGTLERLVNSLPDDRAAAFGERLGAVVTGKADAPAPTAAGVELLGVLDELQDGAPVLLFLDDAQWADPPSLAALTFTLRRLRSDQVLALVALRSGTEGSLPPGLLRLAEGERGCRVSLGGLEALELQDLGATAGVGTLSPRVAQRLFEQTEGNPLYALMLLKELGGDPLAGRGFLPAPPSYSLLVLASLSNLTDAGVRFVQSAAVLGRRCDLATAVRLDDLGDGALLAVEEAIGAGLLQQEDAHGAIAFTHPLTHAAVYGDLGPARRAELHGRAAALLRGEAALAHRVKAAAPEDRSLVEDLVAEAGVAAERAAWANATAHFLSAARLSLDAAQRQHHVLEAAKLMLASLDIAGLIDWRDEIASFPPSADRGYVLGHFEVLMGRREEARALLEEAYAACNVGRDPQTVSRIATQLGYIAVNDGNGAQAAKWARTALEASRGPEFSGSARAVLAVGLAIAGRAEEALAWLEAVTPEDGRAAVIDQVFARGPVRLWTDDLAVARVDLSRVMQSVRSGDVEPLTFPALTYLAETEFRMGLWDDAVVHADVGVSLARDIGAVFALPFILGIAASVYALRGEITAATEHVSESLAVAKAIRGPAELAYACLAAAYLGLARGESATIVEAVEPLLELGDLDGYSEPGVIPWRDLYAEALVRLDRLEEAEVVLKELEVRAGERELRSGMVAAARVRGELEATRGAHDQARAAFEGGLEIAETLPMPFLRGLLELEFDAFLRRRGSRRDAADQLAVARDRFVAMRAEPFLARCDRELAACGRKMATRGSDRRNLTPQELAVAHLVTSGLSNREIAAELVLSVKTIEYHLSNLYAKLGVSSRTQLASSLGQAGQ